MKQKMLRKKGTHCAQHQARSLNACILAIPLHRLHMSAPRRLSVAVLAGPQSCNDSDLRTSTALSLLTLFAVLPCSAICAAALAAGAMPWHNAVNKTAAP